MRVLVTRPAPQAERWVESLRALGLDAVALPLIEIAPPLDSAALHAARLHSCQYQAWMFVSASAVEYFFKPNMAEIRTLSAQYATDLIANPRCWATGLGTAAALQEAGIAAERIDVPSADAVQFDSEALWALVRTQVQPGARVLLVRGGDASGRPAGRAWLGDQIVAAGGICDTVIAYRRMAPAFGEDQRRTAKDGADASAVWLFSSAEAVGNLCRAMPMISWCGARAIATHPRIAQAARGAGFGTVLLSQPGLEAMVASIESLR